MAAISGAKAKAARFPDERLAPTDALQGAQTAVAATLMKLAVEPAGLDSGIADLLVRLSKASDRGIRGVEIGEQCLMSPTRVSRLVDRAEAMGLVERLPDPDDRRAQQIVLTPSGGEAAGRYAPLMAAVLDRVIFESLDTEERDTLVQLLRRIERRAHEVLDAATDSDAEPGHAA